MTTSAYCTRCGAQRPTGDRFCSKCGFDFWQAAAGQTQATGPEPVAAQDATSAGGQPLYPLVIGLAWLGAAAAIAYLAFLQLEYSGSGLIGGDEALQLAAFNGLSALITGYFGARVITGARRGDLLGGVIWALINVAWGAYQVSQGVSHSVFILALVLMALAGLLSFVAWRQAPDDGTGGLSTASKVLLVAIGIVALLGVAVVVSQGTG